MIPRWAFHDCSDKIKNKARSYWEKKQQRLERLASVIPNDEDWVIALMGNEERMTLAELLPDHDSTSTWEELDVATKQLHFNHVLQTLSWQCRHPFLMRSIEGYSVKEISDIQSRSEENVRLDIEKGRESLRAHMDV